ncbi:DUF3455 domain-containing protein [Burkholderia sp. 3C]
MHAFPFVDRLRASQALAPANPRRRALAPAALALLATLAGCATPPPPGPPDAGVPDSLRGPTAELWQETLTAAGDQVYRCHRVTALEPGAPGSPAGQTLRWQPYGPEATLIDAHGQSVGSVTPGRYFLAHDGSFAVGKTLAATIVDANALPWVRYGIDASTRAGDGQGGRMTNISAVIRMNTRGGIPASDACRVEGTQLYVPYFATYQLYRTSPLAQ